MHNSSVWIDVDNSPHVPLFLPFINALEKRSIPIKLTARDFAQTIPLLEKHKLKYTAIGRHYGKNIIFKILGIVVRTIQLIIWARKKNFTLGINHGSRSHVLACWILNIPVFCGLDYEYTESFIFCKFATKIWIPKTISKDGSKHICSNSNIFIRYNGFKEDIYLQNFVPDPEFRKTINVSNSSILITLRPSAELANYHDPKSEEIIISLIDYLKKIKDVVVIFLPRTNGQRDKFKKYISDSFIINKTVYDGSNLVYHSDLVISGGGTMNREAIVLNTPVYSIFSGSKGFLDKKLESEGVLKFINNKIDINKIELCKKRTKINPKNNNENLIEEMLNLFLTNS